MQVNAYQGLPDDQRSFMERVGSIFANPDPLSSAGAEALAERVRLDEARENLERRAQARRVAEGVTSGIGLGFWERGALFPDVPPGSFIPGVSTRPAPEDKPDAPPDGAPTPAAPAAVPMVDMSGILELLPFAQTEAERAALEQSLADLEARASAGMQALGDVWGRVQSVNRAAADRAALMVSQVGARAGALWSNLAQAALEKAGVIAGQFGSPAGRQSINIDPTAGAQNYVALMGSLAPAYEMQARQSQERLARDLGFLSDMAGMQGTAYQGELQRTSMIQAADMARKHNEAVAERVAQNRLKAADLLAQARRTNASLAASGAADEALSPLEQLVEQSALQRAAAEALAGRPDAAQQLADITGIDLPTAQALMADVLAQR